MEHESKFTIMSRLAQDVFQAKYAKNVNELYKKACELHQQLEIVNSISRSIGIDSNAQTTEQRKKIRDDQITAMQIMTKISDALPIVLKDIRVQQITFEQEVKQQYDKQAYNKKCNSTTPLEEDQLWLRVLPEEMANTLPNIIADCPPAILAKFKELIEKEKKTVPESLVGLLDAAQRSTLMTSMEANSLINSKRCTEKLKSSTLHRSSFVGSMIGSEVKKNEKKD
ncbi:Conserved_hypothetical protein [Hexamita inflata]|uniref:Uncharacterized protein n=1 Tax=Hexamita inflata TaxID=28002 RepID=A0AA86V4J7_9EUKA|nr:Conserved hypothetical protein [Hexamita inflata]